MFSAVYVADERKFLFRFHFFSHVSQKYKNGPFRKKSSSLDGETQKSLYIGEKRTYETCRVTILTFVVLICNINTCQFIILTITFVFYLLKYIKVDTK